MSCSNREANLKKLNNMVKIDIIGNVKMADVTLKSIYNIFFRSRSKIQLT